MARLFFLLAILCCSTITPLYAQYFSKTEVLQDLNFYNEALKYGHGINYRQVGKIHIDPMLDSLQAAPFDSVHYVTHYQLLCHAIVQTGCVHTSIQSAPFLAALLPRGSFPLRCVFLNEKLYALNQEDSAWMAYEGKEITHVNGISSARLWEKVRRFRADDGNSGAFGEAYGNLAINRLIAFVLHRPDSFLIDFPSESIKVAGSAKPVTSMPQAKAPVQALQNGVNYLAFLSEETAYLKVKRFAESDMRFFSTAFDSVLKRKPAYLIVDLRANPGGDRKSGVSLTQFLVDTNFSYDIIQPDLNAWPYLTTRGKMFLALSKLKYNIGNVYRIKKTPSGPAFRYRYSPVEEGKRFSGNLFVLTDGITASTSTMVTSWLKQYSRAVFIGTQAGGGYNGNNGASFPLIKLPASETLIRFPAYRLVFDAASEFTAGILPDYPVHYTPDDLMEQKDLEIMQALQLIKDSK